MKILLSIVFILFAGYSHANAVREFSLEECVGNSDFIFIGSLKTTYPMKEDHSQLGSVLIEQIIKGHSKSKKISFYLKTGIAEFETNCCLNGERYIFFVERTKKIDAFQSVNGGYGVYKITDNKIIFGKAAMSIESLRLKIQHIEGNIKLRKKELQEVDLPKELDDSLEKSEKEFLERKNPKETEIPALPEINEGREEHNE